MQVFLHFVYHPKESLYCDGQEFHQYQQNKQVHVPQPQITEHKKKVTTYANGNLGPGWIYMFACLFDGV